MSLPAIDDSPELLDDGERLSIDELRALQLTRLQDTERLRERRPLPRGVRQQGIHPDDIKTLDDMLRNESVRAETNARSAGTQPHSTRVRVSRHHGLDRGTRPEARTHSTSVPLSAGGGAGA